MDKQNIIEGIRLIVIISIFIIIIIGSYKNIMNKDSLSDNDNSKNIDIKDTKSPKLVLKELTINEGDSYNINDFVDSCIDNSDKECILSYKDNIRYKIEGIYDIDIIAKDNSGNITEGTTKLIINRINDINNNINNNINNSEILNFSNEDYSLINKVYEITNEYRLQVGVSPLKIDSLLEEASNIRAKEISNNFSHTRPNGSNCFTVLSELGISYGTAGENIALGYSLPEDVMKGWKDSEGHYQNIISSRFSKIGVSVYKINDQYYWVQLFSN